MHVVSDTGLAPNLLQGVSTVLLHKNVPIDFRNFFKRVTAAGASQFRDWTGESGRHLVPLVFNFGEDPGRSLEACGRVLGVTSRLPELPNFVLLWPHRA